MKSFVYDFLIWCHMNIKSYVLVMISQMIAILIQPGSNEAQGLFKYYPVWIQCRPSVCSFPAFVCLSSLASKSACSGPLVHIRQPWYHNVDIWYHEYDFMFDIIMIHMKGEYYDITDYQWLTDIICWHMISSTVTESTWYHITMKSHMTFCMMSYVDLYHRVYRFEVSFH